MIRRHTEKGRGVHTRRLSGHGYRDDMILVVDFAKLVDGTSDSEIITSSQVLYTNFGNFDQSVSSCPLIAMVSYLMGSVPPTFNILLLSNQHTGVAGITYEDVISTVIDRSRNFLFLQVQVTLQVKKQELLLAFRSSCSCRVICSCRPF